MRRAMVGVGEATFGIFAPAVLADFYPDRERNRILSVFYLAIPVGAALGYLAGGQMGTLWGWRTPFLICAIPGLVVALLYDAIRPRTGTRSFDRPDLETSTRKDHHPFGDFFERFLAILKNPAFLTATFGLAADHLCAGWHLRLGAEVSAPHQRPFRRQRQPRRRRHYRGRRHRRHHCRRLDRASLAAQQPSRALFVLVLERRTHSALRRARLLRPHKPGDSRARCRRVLHLPQHRPAQRRHRQLGQRRQSAPPPSPSISSAFTSSATRFPRRSSAPSATAPL